jgi:hypothetical protein
VERRAGAGKTADHMHGTTTPVRAPSPHRHAWIAVGLNFVANTALLLAHDGQSGPVVAELTEMFAGSR